MVVPQALKVIRLRPDRKFCVLGRLAHEVGWHHADLIKKLEAQRKVKEQAYYAEKKAKVALRAKAAQSAVVPAAVQQVLVNAGYA